MALTGQQFDLPVTPASHSLVVCASARTGSTWLAHLLAERGYGIADEYLNSTPPFRGAMQKRLGGNNAADYLARVVSCRTSRSGVFAIKVFASHLRGAGMELDDLLRMLPGEKTLVHLRREDVDAQAVSALIASQSGVWQHEQLTPMRLKYRPLQIKRLRDRMRRSVQYWQESFAAIGHQPLEITYESLRDDTEATLARIASAVGVPFDVSPADLPDLPRVAQETKQDWLTRWHEVRA